MRWHEFTKPFTWSWKGGFFCYSLVFVLSLRKCKSHNFGQLLIPGIGVNPISRFHLVFFYSKPFDILIPESSRIGISLDWDADCGDALQLCLEFCRHWALKEGTFLLIITIFFIVTIIMLNTITYWFLARSSLHLNPWEVPLHLDWGWSLCSFKQFSIKGVIQSHGVWPCALEWAS